MKFPWSLIAIGGASHFEVGSKRGLSLVFEPRKRMHVSNAIADLLENGLTGMKIEDPADIPAHVKFIVVIPGGEQLSFRMDPCDEFSRVIERVSEAMGIDEEGKLFEVIRLGGGRELRSDELIGSLDINGYRLRVRFID